MHASHSVSCLVNGSYVDILSDHYDVDDFLFLSQNDHETEHDEDSLANWGLNFGEYSTICAKDLARLDDDKI